jgi:Tfp pilus assembly protein PilF
VSPAEQTAKTIFDRGVAALGRADLPAAEAAFQRCLELAPDSAETWCYLGITLSSKEFARAAAALDRALALDSNHLGALYWRAEVDWVEGNPGSAAKMLRRFNDLVPDASQNLARLGLAYMAAGETKSAMAALREAVDAGGGLAGIGTSHPELRRAIYLDLLGRREEAVRLVESINRAGVSPDLPRARYPRDIDVQIRALENVVAGRDIVILGSGPSLEELQPALAALGARACERFCFFGFNNVPVPERMLYETIGRGIDLACMTSASVIELHAAWIAGFLDRNATPNLFLTLADALPAASAQAAMAARRSEKFFYFSSNADYPPIPEDPLHFPPINTLMCVLPLAVLGRPRRMFMFGCDGAAPLAIERGAPVYFRQGSADYGAQPMPQSSPYSKWLVRDTFFFNAQISIVLDCLSVLHRVQVPPIYICNPDSAYRPFPRISAAEFTRMQAMTRGI